MGLLDGIIGSALGGQGLGAGLGAILGGSAEKHAGILPHLIETLNTPEVGGLGGLLSHLQSGGLGSVVASWIGTGTNHPVTAEQLQNALPAGLLNQLSSRTGLDATQLSHALAQILPGLVDHLTPNGSLPQGGGLQEALGGLLSSLAPKAG